MAKAIQTDKQLAKEKTGKDILYDANAKFQCCTLLERDVKLAFFKQNYSDKATNRAIKQWVDLGLVWGMAFKGYRIIAFYETITDIPNEPQVV